jgi:hypothetical protein
MTPHQTLLAHTATSHHASPTCSATPTSPSAATHSSASLASAHRAANTPRRFVLPTLAALLLCLAPQNAHAQQALSIAPATPPPSAVVPAIHPPALTPVAPPAPVWTDADTADFVVTPTTDYHNNEARALHIRSYKGTKKDIVIPDKIDGKAVVEIGDDVFKDKGLTSVVLPKFLIFIGARAFENNQLKTLIIPKFVQRINSSAFRANKITNLVIPGNIRYIDTRAFESNELTSVIFELEDPDASMDPTSRKIGAHAFGKNKLTSLTFHDRLAFYTSLDCFAFADNPLTHIFLAHGVFPREWTFDGEDEDNPKGPFYELWYKLNKTSEQAGTYIKKDGVWKRLGEFYEKDGFVIEVRRKEGKEVVLVEYKGTEKDIVIPEEIHWMPITAIADGVFRNKGLTSVVLPPELEKIGKEAFASNKITSVVIPDDVKTIGENAFASNALTSLKFAQNGAFGVTIEEGAFSSNKLTSAILTLRNGRVAKRAFVDNPLSTVYILSWEFRLDDAAFEKSLQDYRKESGNLWGIFEKKNGVWTWGGSDEAGKYWKREER